MTDHHDPTQPHPTTPLPPISPTPPADPPTTPLTPTPPAEPPTTPLDGPPPSADDDRIRAAFGDLAARSTMTHPTPARPVPGSPAANGARRGAHGGRSPWLLAAPAGALAAALLVVGSVAFLGRGDNSGEGQDLATSEGIVNDEETPATDEVPTVDLDGLARVERTAFDLRTSTDVFLVTDDGSTLRAGFASSPSSFVVLPADAEDAAPDGLGGVVYATPGRLWRLPAGGSEAELLIDAGDGVTVNLVGPRTVGGGPVVVAWIGGKLISIDPDGGSNLGALLTGLQGVDGTVIDLDVDGTVVAAVVEDGDERRTIQTLTIGGDGTPTVLTEPEAVDADAAPVAVAVVGNRLVVADRSDIATVLTLDGSEAGTLRLPAAPVAAESGGSGPDAPTGLFAIDGSDGRLLVAFGEAALIVSLDGEERRTVDGPPGWVRSAVWADRPENTTTVPEPGDPGARYRVDTQRVAADASDPFLNLRADPDASADLVAKLPPTYRGLRATGETAQAADGGTWLEVELLHPVAVDPVEPLDGDPPSGWLNGSFVLPLVDGLSVGTDEVPACTAEGSVGPGGQGPGGGSWHLAALESGLVAPDCLRIVIHYGTGTAPASWLDAGPGAATPASNPPRPNALEFGGSLALVDLGAVSSAWPGAVTTDDGVYLTRRFDRTVEDSLDLLIPRSAGSLRVTEVPALGAAVIDLTLDPVPQLPASDGVALTRAPVEGDGFLDVVGIARPFEATLDVALVDTSGQPVEAVFSGSRFLGPSRTTEYGVDTTDWLEAWGTFALRVAAPAGDYTLVLSPAGGAVGSANDPATLRLPITISGSAPGALPDADALAAAQALVDLARGSSTLDYPAADQVILGLGPDESRVVAGAELTDRATWTFDTEDFGGFSGPFNALDTLARTRTSISDGPVNHCAGGPRDWPAAYDGLQQVNLTSIGIDSCIQWAGIHILLDDDGAIAAVVLDLFGP